MVRTSGRFSWSRPLRKYRVAQIPSLPVLTPTIQEPRPRRGERVTLAPPEVARLTSLPGFGSSTEGLVAAWLLDAGWFETVEELRLYSQVYVRGGRNRPGGYVLDFVMPPSYYPPTIITVIGSYWHSLSGVEARDIDMAIWAQTNNYRVVEIPEAITLDAIQFQAFMEENIGRR